MIVTECILPSVLDGHPDDLTEEEKLEPLKNTADDSRILLLNRLYAKKRKELKDKEKLKIVELEEEHVDERSVDDLLTFINGEGDCKAVKAAKTKKKNKKKKGASIKILKFRMVLAFQQNTHLCKVEVWENMKAVKETLLQKLNLMVMKGAYILLVGVLMVLTVSADKTAKVWDITDDGIGKLNRTMASLGTGGVEDMIIGCLWQNDNLVTVSLGGTISIFLASDPTKEPASFSGHMKGINTLTSFLQDGKRVILTTSYDGVVSRWVPGIGYDGKLQWNTNLKIKSFAAVEEKIIAAGFDNKVNRRSVEKQKQ